jgi:hypothetical protein
LKAAVAVIPFPEKKEENSRAWDLKGEEGHACFPLI